MIKIKNNKNDGDLRYEYDTLAIVMVFLVESTKSIKPTQLFIESPENLIPLEEKFFILVLVRSYWYYIGHLVEQNLFKCIDF